MLRTSALRNSTKRLAMKRLGQEGHQEYNFCINYKPEMAVVQEFDIADCLVEPHLLHFLVKVKIISY